MQKIIVILLLLTNYNLFAQKGIQYISVEQGRRSIDTTYQKIIGKEMVEFKDGTKGKYYVVEYDYGEPPPDQFEIVRSFLMGDTLVRGWKINYEELFRMTGWTEGIFSYKVTATNTKATFFKPIYIDTLDLSYGGTPSLQLIIR